MNYLEQLKEKSDKYNSIVCMGMDPDLNQIPVEGDPGERIYVFFENILNEIIKKKIFPASVKPNYAFYAQYGLEGIETLKKLIDLYREEGIPVILDVKRGDIGKTARAYASEAYDFFMADAVTLSPYMGYDSISPFLESYPEKGCYILTKTSNNSSSDLQDIEYREEALYMYVADMIMKWYKPGVGSVIGATYPEQLQGLWGKFSQSEKEVPLLIPGIGAQGGDLKSVIEILKSSGDIRIHRINSSSGINYAYKRYKGLCYKDAAVKALEELNNEIEEYISG
jgi:orotidine-5'-phosphate decarboxylase